MGAHTLHNNKMQTILVFNRADKTRPCLVFLLMLSNRSLIWEEAMQHVEWLVNPNKDIAKMNDCGQRCDKETRTEERSKGLPN